MNTLTTQEISEIRLLLEHYRKTAPDVLSSPASKLSLVPPVPSVPKVPVIPKTNVVPIVPTVPKVPTVPTSNVIDLKEKAFKETFESMELNPFYETVMNPVVSKAVSHEGYNPTTNTLSVTFINSGDTYDYSNVTQELYDELKAATSFGNALITKFINNKEKHPSTKRIIK